MASALLAAEHPEERVRKRFERETAEHEMTVLRDDGVYRHLRFQAPGTWCMGFDLVTWPGYLFIGGDVDDFVFARTLDMFDFFDQDRRSARGINPHYWSQKLQVPRQHDGALVYTPEQLRARILEWANERLEEWDDEAAELQEYGELEEHPAVYPSLLAGALEREILHEDLYRRLPDNEREAHQLLADHQWLFGETWEWSLRGYDEWFLWACWAIVWGIEKYKAWKAGRVAQGASALAAAATNGMGC